MNWGIPVFGCACKASAHERTPFSNSHITVDTSSGMLIRNHHALFGEASRWQLLFHDEKCKTARGGHPCFATLCLALACMLVMRPDRDST